MWPLVVVGAFLSVEVRFLAHSSWRPVMLYDGDSLTLPLLWNALSHGEPLHPVMSPQLLIFPEGAVYALARLCTTSIGASLVAVAYLNMALLYLGLRAVAEMVVRGSASRRRVAALVPTLLLIAAMLLERVMGVNATTIATPFLFNSFYAGAILVGVGALAFAAWQLRRAAASSLRARLAAGAAVTAALALAMISDPLVIVQITAPFLVVVTGLWALRRLRRSQVAWIAGPHIGAVVLYEALMPLYRRYLGKSGSRYLRTNHIGAAWRTLEADMHLILRSATGRGEMALLAGAWAAGIVTTVVALRREGGRPQQPTGAPAARLLVSAFAAMASVWTLAAIVVAGEGMPRYLLPLVTFPFVGLVPAANLRWARTGPARAGVAPLMRLAPVTVLTAITVLGFTAIPGAATILEPGPVPVNARYGTPAGESCLGSAFGDRPVSGVASYWTARALDAYNTHHQRILQVRRDLTIFPWLINLGSYEHRHFTFVIVDGSRHDQLTMESADLAGLGRPERIVACPGFAVYTYPPGSAGYVRLNATIDRSLQADLKRLG